jgi:CDP-diacylglycerol---glycerol-3-phosphate 3-phosphatidyltransferase
MFDGRWREGVDRVTGPVGRQLVRAGVTADVLTASGLVFAVATAVVVATGHLLIGIPLLAITGFHDLFDGPVAKAAGTASVRGAFFDSVADRLADAVLMAGVAWYLVSVREGELALLPLAVLGAASLVSYERAKADALGLPVTNKGIFGGLMERAERMILLGAGFLEPWLLVPVLWVLLGTTLLTAVARFVSAWRAAQGPAHVVRARRPVLEAWGEGTVGARWRGRRHPTRVSAGERGELAARWRARRQEALAMRGARRTRRQRTEATRGRHPGHAGHGGQVGPGAGDRGG